MNARKLAVLGGVLAALCALAGVAFWRSDRVETVRPLKSLKEGDVSKLLIDRGTEHIVLERSGGLWRMSSPVPDLADAAAVSDVLQGLLALSLGSEVSREPESYPSYALSESSATRVRLMTANAAAPAFDAYFGKEALGYDSLYVRLAGEKPVSLASGLGSYRLNRKADDLRERSLLGLDKGILRSVKIRAGARTVDLEKSTSEWTCSGCALKPEAVESLVSRIAVLRVAEFPASAAAPGFDKPFLVIEAEGTLKKARLTFGALRPEKDKKQAPLYRFAKADGREPPLLASISELDDLLEAAQLSKPKPAKKK